MVLVWTMSPPKVKRSTIAGRNQEWVNYLVRETLSLLAIAPELVMTPRVPPYVMDGRHQARGSVGCSIG